MGKYFLTALILHIAVLAFGKTAEGNNNNRCYQTVNDAQKELNLLISQLKNVSENANLPKIDDDAQKIKTLKKLIKTIKQLQKEEPDITAKEELLNINKISKEIDLNLEKMEKKIHKIKLDSKPQNYSSLEDIFEVIKKTGASLAVVNEFHDNVSKTCKLAEERYKYLEKDTEDINNTLASINYESRKMISRHKDIWEQHELLQKDAVENEEMINNIKIPQSSVSQYLCNREQNLQKKIDENLNMLEKNKDMLKIIIGDFEMGELQAAKVLEETLKLIDDLNNDVVTVNDALKYYESKIPEKLNDSVSTKEVNELESDVVDLEKRVSKLFLDKTDTSQIEVAIQEFERKINVLTFITSDENLKKVSDEVGRLKAHEERIYKIDTEKKLLEEEEKQIKRQINVLLKQTLCQKAQNEP